MTIDRAVLASLFVLAALPVRGEAQTPTGHSITPAEYKYGTDLYVGNAMTPISSQTRVLIRPDSVSATVKRQTQAWIDALLSAPVTGMQLDPMGVLAIKGGHEALAQQQFAARLATPGLSRADSAYTLGLAVRAFSSSGTPASIPTALTYMTQLDAMAPAVALERYEAHGLLARAYYVIGQSEAVATHALAAFAIAPTIPYARRGPMFMDGLFVVFADAVSGLPNGRARIDSLAAVYLPLATPPADLVAADPTYATLARGMTRNANAQVSQAASLGKPIPPLIATHWYNTAAPSTSSNVAPGAAVKPLADGVIRILEYGEYTCIHCLRALPGMERIRKASPPGVEVWYVTRTKGSWGATLFEPDEEAKRLYAFYVTHKGYGLPIALWAGPKEPTPERGLLPRESPSFAAFSVTATPTFIITDGKGIVRHITTGYSPAIEALLRAKLQFLVAERQRQTS